MQVVLFEDEGFENLLPLLYWRSVFELRIGRKIILDHLAQHLKLPIAGIWTRDWIAAVAAQRCGAPVNQPLDKPTLLINGRWLMEGTPDIPDKPGVGLIDGQVAYITCDKKLAASLAPREMFNPNYRQAGLTGLPTRPASGRMLNYPWELIGRLSEILADDWCDDDAGIASEVAKTSIEEKKHIHVGERVAAHRTCLLDASSGPIYIADGVTIGPYAVIQGPAYIGPGTRISPHAWLHSGNAIGPVCRLGGEICGCIITGYTNKQHHGFLGHSYVGSWVNIGAGATNSNLKNTYGKIRVPLNGKEVETGLQFFGAVIGDHAKIGINATLPTGAVVSTGACVISTDPTPKFVPPFAWAMPGRVVSGDHLRAMDVAVAMMLRRKVEMTDEEVELFSDLGDRVKQYA